ncbi:hypothetical protein SUDANB120_02917 [Streptomyces sp. enrichment culture]
MQDLSHFLARLVGSDCPHNRQPRPRRWHHARVTSELPAGWTLERVRALSADPTATPLSLDRLVVVEAADQADYERLWPDLIPAFHGLCLVRHDGEWLMGHLDKDGSVLCWASYGPELAEAIHSL